MKTRLSMIIPMYNVEDYLRRCLDSCLDQKDVSSEEYEIVVVNDGSTDRSLEIASEYVPRIRLVSQSNHGQGAARNAALELAEGEYVWFVDSDDWVSDNSVAVIFRMVDRYHPDFVAIAAEMSGKVRQRLEWTEDPKKLFLGNTWRDCPPFYVCSKAFLDRNGLRFKTGFYHEDSEFTPRMIYLAGSCAVSSEILYHVFERPGSTTRTADVARSYDMLEAAGWLCRYQAENDVPSPYAERFREHAVIMTNCALRKLNGLSEQDIQGFEKALASRKDILACFADCGKLKYKLEAVLFRLAGGRYSAVFNLLDRLKR